MVFTQGFHSFTSYRIKQKSEVLILMCFLQLLSVHKNLDARINGGNLVVSLERETCFNFS